MTDRQIQLVITSQNGDTKSFEELYSIYHKSIYILAKTILRNKNDAEDILQETFIKAWRSLNTLENPFLFAIWLQKIARNLCSDQMRKKNFTIILDAEKDIEDLENIESDEFIPAVYMERSDLQERLGRIVDKLSDVQREAIILYYYNELTVGEIANIMECSENTVKTRLYLARKTIRAEIEEKEKKSGEKFYGIIGIPMLPFGKMILSQIESISINQTAANDSLNVITSAISNNTSSISKVANKNSEDKIMAFCLNCGTPVDDAKKFCTGCGQSIGQTSTQTTQPQKKKSKTQLIIIIALVLIGAFAATVIFTNGFGLLRNSNDNDDPTGSNNPTNSNTEKLENKPFTIDKTYYSPNETIIVSMNNITQKMVDDGAVLVFYAVARNGDNDL